MRWMRWIGFLAVAAGAALGLVGATPGPACACSCVQSSLRSSFDRADVVFAGKLVSRDETSNQKATLVYEVSSVYKGEVTARQEIVTHASSATCGLELSGRGPHLVFGSTAASDFEPAPAAGQYVSSLCGGSRHFDQATQAELRPLAAATEPIQVRSGPVEPKAVRPETQVPPADLGEPAEWWDGAPAVGAVVLVAAAGIGVPLGVLAWRRRRRSAGSRA